MVRVYKVYWFKDQRSQLLVYINFPIVIFSIELTAVAYDSIYKCILFVVAMVHVQGPSNA